MTGPSPTIWFCYHSGPDNYAYNMAMDHALLENAALIGHPTLRFFSWTEPAASFGYFQKIAEIERMTLLRPLVRRPTGGGLVPQDADWTYSVAVPPSDPWYELKAVESYRSVHEWVCAAFAKMGVTTELAPSRRQSLPGQCFAGWEQFDVLWSGRKIAGAAQRRTRQGLLIQGSVQPPPLKLARADWESAMCDVAQSARGVQWRDFTPDELLRERAEALASGTYSRDTHNRKR